MNMIIANIAGFFVMIVLISIVALRKRPSPKPTDQGEDPTDDPRQW